MRAIVLGGTDAGNNEDGAAIMILCYVGMVWAGGVSPLEKMDSGVFGYGVCSGCVAMYRTRTVRSYRQRDRLDEQVRMINSRYGPRKKFVRYTWRNDGERKMTYCTILLTNSKKDDLLM